MGFPVAPALDRPFARRAAFLLNANARAVNDRLIEELAEIIPAGDLFLSRTLEDAEIFVRTIARRGYGRVFFGGGDGTLVTSLKLLRQACAKEALPMPAVGVLKLGTGNAMALTVGAQGAVVDASHVINKGPVAEQPVHLVECEDGTLTPFAGMGYDGAVLNDYVWLKKKVKDSPLGRRVVETLWGYLGAMLLKTVPSELRAELPRVKVTSKSDAILMVATPEGDVEKIIPAGTVLFHGQAPIMSVGAIPFFGYGFTMFPFAQKKPGYVQLRIGTIPIPLILANLWPRVWKGTFRYDGLKDFLVKDVVIESDRELPYQLGGDARGSRSRLAFKVAEEPISMQVLGERLVPQGHTVLQLGPARLLLRLPR
ncbi:MAG TPA: diacylglycerol kinase family protein [Myxococcota bacterium]|jgi:diacylglycerol kinase family enzyme